MIRISGIRDGRIVQSADESGNVHVERPSAGGIPVIESVHVFRVRWDTPDEERAIFGAVRPVDGQNHAAGPWWMKRALLGGYRVYSRFRPIATVRTDDSRQELRATARLITAAPELLATLNKLEIALRRNAAVYEEHKALLQRARGLVFRIKRED
jgi:hypothetical protein